MEQALDTPLPVTVVVLAYNSAEFLPVCLKELARSRGVDLDTIVVDNASRDDSAAVARRDPSAPRVFRTEQNLGCAGGNNFGWRRGRHPYVVFLNPDCAVMPDSIVALVRPLVQDPKVGMTGARLLYPHSRRIQHAGGILHPNAMCEHIGVNETDDGRYAQDRDVDYVTGALIAMRRVDLESLGGYDEEYWPAYYEETDLCARLKRRGMTVRYVADAIAYHWESPSVGRKSAALVRMSYRARIRYLVKNRTVGEWLGEVIPFEWKWFWGPFAKGFRGPVVRSYLEGLLFALHCLARFSRRARGPQPSQAARESGSAGPS